MVLRRKAMISVDLVHQSKEIPQEKLNDFQEWLIYKAKEKGSGWHHEYYCVDESHFNDIHVKFLVTITFDSEAS